MGTYLMMMYVSLEQEKAVHQLFKKEKWKYSKLDLMKTTDMLGPLVPASSTISEQDLSPVVQTKSTRKRKPPARFSKDEELLKKSVVSKNKKSRTQQASLSDFAKDIKDDIANAIVLNEEGSDYGDDDDDFQDETGEDNEYTVACEENFLIDLENLETGNDGLDVLCATKGDSSKANRLVKAGYSCKVEDDSPGPNTSTNTSIQSTDMLQTRSSSRNRKLIFKSHQGHPKPLDQQDSNSKTSKNVRIQKPEVDIKDISEAMKHRDGTSIVDSYNYVLIESEASDFKELYTGIDAELDEALDAGYKDDTEPFLTLTAVGELNDSSDTCTGETSVTEESQTMTKATRAKRAKSVCYSCKLCDKMFAKLHSLKLHEQTVHSVEYTAERQYRCNICGHRYYMEHHLQQHTVDKHGQLKPGQTEPEFKCEKCGKTFFQKRCYNIHMKSHDVKMKKSFVCEYCAKPFARKDVLQWHTKTVHLGIKRPTKEASLLPRKFKCEECGDKFKRKQHLTDHIAIKHLGTGLKNKCDKCNESFIRPHLLEYHINKVHMKQKPHMCNKCQVGFYSTVALRKHMAICYMPQSEMYSCDKCSLRFTSSRNLSMHKEAIHSENPLTCACGVVVKWKSSMAKHRRKCKLSKHSLVKSMMSSQETLTASDNIESTNQELNCYTQVLRVKKHEVMKEGTSDRELETRQMNIELASLPSDSSSMCDNIDIAGVRGSDPVTITEISENPLTILSANALPEDANVPSQYSVGSIIEGRDDAQKSVYYVILKE